MHRWLLVLLIALLPLRGWVGEAMAGQMLQQRLAAIEAAAAQVHGAPGHALASDAQDAVTEDCHGHGMAHAVDVAAVAQDAQPSGWQADCPTCASCQVCSAVALLLPANPLLAAPAVTQPLPQGLPRLGLSAERAELFKPPIS